VPALLLLPVKLFAGSNNNTTQKEENTMVAILLAIAFVMVVIILFMLAFGGRGGQKYDTSNGQNMGNNSSDFGGGRDWNGETWA
jgi:hypothetical protein